MRIGIVSAMKTLGERVRSRRITLGLSQQELADAVGMSQQGIVSIESGASERPRKLLELANVLGVSPEWLQNNEENVTPPTANRQTSKPSHNKSHESTSQNDGFTRLMPTGGRDLPVLGAAKGGTNDGVFVENGKAFDYVVRPGNLIGSRDAYAVYMVGDSMEDRYYAGEILHINPNKPIKAGDFVVVQIEPSANAEWQYFVKQYVRHDAKKLVLREFNPKRREIDFAAVTVRGIHKIVGSSSES